MSSFWEIYTSQSAMALLSQSHISRLHVFIIKVYISVYKHLSLLSPDGGFELHAAGSGSRTGDSFLHTSEKRPSLSLVAKNLFEICGLNDQHLVAIAHIHQQDAGSAPLPNQWPQICHY
jgi:hypothetical protein